MKIFQRTRFSKTRKKVAQIWHTYKNIKIHEKLASYTHIRIFINLIWKNDMYEELIGNSSKPTGSIILRRNPCGHIRRR